MSDPNVTERTWVIDLVPDEVRLRCSYRRRQHRIIKFTVQVEVFCEGAWQPAVRYDNAHGFCHRDTIHADGSQEKEPVYYGDANDTFTQAIEDLKANWEAHRNRFLKESNK